MRFTDFARYEQIREVGGIAWSDEHGGFWAVVDHDLVRAIAADDRRFVSSMGVRIPPNGTPPTFALEYDRPRHTVHRRILTEAVGPRAAPTLEARVRGHARRLLDEALACGGNRVDLGEDYAFRLSLDVMFDLIGAPPELKEEVEQLAEALFLYRTPLPDGSDPAHRLRQILEDMVASRIAVRRDDWLGQIIAYRNDTELSLTETEIHGAIVALLVGGHHSTARATACLLARLASDPTLQARLRAEPELIAVAAEETVRLHTPLRWFARTARAKVQLRDVTVRPGERVMLLYAGANRDPAYFDTPDQFRLDRPKANDHLAFGWGIHRCVGMPLATLEIRVAVEEVLARTSCVCLEEEVAWTSSTEPRQIPARFS
ncbi:cytochrome P450 [Pseudonocardia eucalypti]|nr:cytochrome P450 [Pseudonocardia eucalypti]